MFYSQGRLEEHFLSLHFARLYYLYANQDLRNARRASLTVDGSVFRGRFLDQYKQPFFFRSLKPVMCGNQRHRKRTLMRMI